MTLTSKTVQSVLDDIIDVDIHTEVKGYEPLTTAFYLDRLDSVSRAVDMTDEINVHQAAGVSMMAHRHPCVRQQLADVGFFDIGLNQLLDLAEGNDLMSGRLVPIFGEAAEQAEDLKLSDELVDRLIDEMNRARAVWGFAVIGIGEDGYEISLAEETEICA